MKLSKLRDHGGAVPAVSSSRICAAVSEIAAAVADWAVDLPAQQRSQLGLTGAVPDPVTFWRVLTRVDAAGLQQALGAWLRSVLASTTPVVPGRCRPRLVLAVDGKALRATR